MSFTWKMTIGLIAFTLLFAKYGWYLFNDYQPKPPAPGTVLQRTDGTYYTVR